MTVDLRPWRRMLLVWLPAVFLCLVAAAVFLWQNSESGGRSSQLRNRVVELDAELARLEALERATSGDRERVAQLDEQFGSLYVEVFGSLDERLTSILREVGSATRNAGLLPGTYSYSASEDKKSGFIRFGIQFSVKGEYHQIRQLLAELQSSPEFLVVQDLGLSGDEDPVSRDLGISLRLATFVAEADENQLRRLTGGIARTTGGDDG